MTQRFVDTYGREVRDTVVKSGLSGMAATVLAVTFFSPAGLGGLIGTSVASGAGVDPSASSSDDPYTNLPAFPSPLTRAEVDNIRGKLAATTASLEIARAASDPQIERLRRLAGSPRDVAVTATTGSDGGLRLTLNEPVAEEVVGPAPLEITPISYSFGGGDPVQFRDPHLELAELFFAHERY